MHPDHLHGLCIPRPTLWLLAPQLLLDLRRDSLVLLSYPRYGHKIQASNRPPLKGRRIEGRFQRHATPQVKHRRQDQESSEAPPLRQNASLSSLRFRLRLRRDLGQLLLRIRPFHFLHLIHSRLIATQDLHLLPVSTKLPYATMDIRHTAVYLHTSHVPPNTHPPSCQARPHLFHRP